MTQFIKAALVFVGGFATFDVWAADACEVVLTTRAFNTSDFSSSLSVMSKQRRAVCDETYQSVQEATRAAKSVGGGVSYAGFGFNASEATQSGQSSYRIDSTKFCMASDDQIESAMSVASKVQVTDTAVNAWLQCVQGSNKLFEEYRLNDSGNVLSITLHRYVSDSGFGNITGIDVKGDEVRCTVSGKSVNLSTFETRPITKGKTSISCLKSPESSVVLTIATDQGDLPPIDWPSAKELQMRRTENRDSLVQKAQALLVEVRQELALAQKRVEDLTRASASKEKSIEKLESRQAVLDCQEFISAGSPNRKPVSIALPNGYEFVAKRCSWSRAGSFPLETDPTGRAPLKVVDNYVHGIQTCQHQGTHTDYGYHSYAIINACRALIK